MHVKLLTELLGNSSQGKSAIVTIKFWPLQKMTPEATIRTVIMRGQNTAWIKSRDEFEVGSPTNSWRKWIHWGETDPHGPGVQFSGNHHDGQHLKMSCPPQIFPASFTGTDDNMFQISLRSENQHRRLNDNQPRGGLGFFLPAQGPRHSLDSYIMGVSERGWHHQSSFSCRWEDGLTIYVYLPQSPLMWLGIGQISCLRHLLQGIETLELRVKEWLHTLHSSYAW